mmetsp:Transcript_57351/g.124613  ORF Transcript_57351/g.124613 Transcript_57351/m.124613 type:complete len:202 (+) Transcript_57351:125-730(+)
MLHPLGIVRPVVAGYMHALSTQPVLTNIVTASGLSVLSDSVAQRLDPTTSTWDVGRAMCIALWGAVVSGYLLPHWLRLLARLFPNAATSITALVLKVGLNQAVMSPGLNGGFFTFAIFTREQPRFQMPKHKRQMLVAKLKADLPSTILRSCGYWSVVQTLNFRLIPEQFALLWTNLAFVIWSVYVSFIGFRRVGKSDSKLG